MKVKNESYLRSLTAILRQNLKNSSDPSARHWYSTVPSITYIWTHKPLWRRRHKNRKKSNSHRFPLSSINSRINDIDLWDTLKSTDSRLCSRSSTSPYETCSSRPIVNESALKSNNRFQQNLEHFSFNQRRQSFERKLPISETQSDSGLRRGRPTQIQSIRSHRRLTLRNSSNSQSIVGALSSLEINKSIELSVTGDTLSDIGIPKRHVTFNNYVSKSSLTDTRSQISTINDDDDDEDDNDDPRACWWQSSYDRLTDTDENLLQADLSCLFSSMIFDDSQSSFFSTKSENLSEKSEIIKKLNESSSTIGCCKSIFYLNSMYSNESSCNLDALPVEIFNDNYEVIESSRQKNDDEDDFVTVNQFGEKRSEKMKKISDAGEIPEINTDLISSRSIDCITVELKNISSTVKEILIESGDREKEDDKSLSKNRITRDENDLTDLKGVSSFVPVADFLSMDDVDVKNGNFRGNRIFEFFWQPKNRMDTDFFRKEKNRIDNDFFRQTKNSIEADFSRQTKNSIEADFSWQSKNPIEADFSRQMKNLIEADFFRQTKNSIEADFSRQTKNSIEADFSRQTKNSIEADFSRQTKNSIETDFSRQTKNSIEADFSRQTKNSIEADFSQQTKNSIEADFSRQTKNSIKADFSRQTKNSIEADFSRQTKNSIEADFSRQTKNSIEADFSRQTKNLIEADFSWQKKNSVEADFSRQTKNSIEADFSRQTKNSIETDFSRQTKNSIEADFSWQTKHSIETDFSCPSKNRMGTEILPQPKKLTDTDFFRQSKNRIETNFLHQPKNEINVSCQPKNCIDTDFLLKELSKVGAQTFANFNKKQNEEIYKIRESEIIKNSRKEIIEDAKRLRIDLETYGDRESIFIEMKNFGDFIDDNKILKKSSSLGVSNCLTEGCESIVINLAEVKKNSGLLDLSISNFHDNHEKSSTLSKSCVICGRKNIENPRYLRPVCQVLGVTPSSRLDNDPWINVINRVIQHDSRKNVLPMGMSTQKNDHQSQELSKDLSNDENSTNDYSPLVRNEFGTVVEKVVKECCGIIHIDAENNSPSTPATIDSSIVSSREQSTSCPLEPEMSSSTSFGFTTLRGPRTQSAKTYFMRESVKTVEGTANRLLCVISETDMMMTLPPFLSKKPPDWFARQIPMKKSSRH